MLDNVLLGFGRYIGDPLSFAVYTVFPLCLFLFIVGATYRIVRILIVLPRKRWITSRAPVGVSTLVLGAINVFIYPILMTVFKNKKDVGVGFFGVHFLGVIPLIFLLSQHVAIFAYFIPLYSILWPLAIPLSFNSGLTIAEKILGIAKTSAQSIHSLWGPLVVVLNGDVLTIIALVAFGFKLGERIYATIREHQRPSDALMMIHVVLILLTGFAAAHHLQIPGLDPVISYKILLASHIVLASVFAALIPYTKYWHFVFSMYFGKFVEWLDRTWMRGAALEGGRLTPPRRKVQKP